MSMPDRKRTIALAVVVFFHMTVMAGVYINAAYPVWTGRAIRMKTLPIDPRSLFRGNYARLSYTVSRIPMDEIDRTIRPRHGEPVYVKLTPGTGGLWEYDGIALEAPADGLFLRGRIRYPQRESSRFYTVTYGIEAYFAPKEKALALEKRLRQSAVATIKVAKNGRAALLGVDDGSE